MILSNTRNIVLLDSAKIWTLIVIPLIEKTSISQIKKICVTQFQNWSLPERFPADNQSTAACPIARDDLSRVPKTARNGDKIVYLGHTMRAAALYNKIMKLSY